MNALLEQTAALGEPVQVRAVGQVVDNPHREDHDEGEHEGP